MAFQIPEGVAAVYDHFIVMARKARIMGLETAQEGNTSTAPCDARHGRREERDTMTIGPGVNRHDLSLDMEAVNKGRVGDIGLREHHAQDGREAQEGIHVTRQLMTETRSIPCNKRRLADCIGIDFLEHGKVTGKILRHLIWSPDKESCIKLIAKELKGV